jgi:hypothetical protein
MTPNFCASVNFDARFSKLAMVASTWFGEPIILKIV